MARAHMTQITSQFPGASPRRSALHLLAEIRVTARGKQVQFYWSAGGPGERSGQAGPVWRTVLASSLAQPGSAEMTGSL